MILVIPQPSNDSNLLYTVLSGFAGAVFVWIISLLWESFKECKRSNNLIAGVKNEMSNNIEYIEHNKSVSEMNNTYPVNLILFENHACRNLLYTGNVSLKQDVRKQIAHSIVVIEHLNAIQNGMKLDPSLKKNFIENLVDGNDSLKKNCEDVMTLLNQ